MQPRNLAAFMLVAGSMLACASVRAAAPDYGKVDTFQPGSKYNCVPTADRKGWNCAAVGKFTPPAEPATPAPHPAPVTPPAHTAPPVPTTPAPAAAELPGYLSNSAASQPMRPMRATPTPKPAPLPRVKAKPIPAQVTAQPVAAQAAKPAEPAAPAQAKSMAVDASNFLTLPPDDYVIELAHGATRTDLATTPHPSRAKVYELHLRQNDSDEWLLLWGPFTNLDSARVARGELVAQGTTPGWPRRVGPLQAEAHRLTQ